MLPSWQLLYPNKSLQAFFLPEIDVVSQNCKTQNTPCSLNASSVGSVCGLQNCLCGIDKPSSCSCHKTDASETLHR